MVAVVAVTGLAPVLSGCGSATRSDESAATNSGPARTIEAGSVTVKLRLRQLNVDGAVFEIIFDTHDVELDQDMIQDAHLVVGEAPWPTEEWSGDGTGGHHREGELRFSAAGPAEGIATLSIDGLPEPVIATWDIGSSSDGTPPLSSNTSITMEVIGPTAVPSTMNRAALVPASGLR